MPEVVISNTTPIITLLGIGKIGVLKDLYGEVIIPEAVAREIEQGKDKVSYIDLKTLDWIKIRPLQNRTLYQYLLNELDEGEAEVIALAQELSARLLIIDERLARHKAGLNNFVCVGTLGLLLKAKEKGLITAIEPLLMQMQANGIWLAESLIEQVLRQAGER
jgi:predicted nucleic acid-binding protein